MKDKKNVRSCFARVYLWVCVLGLSTFSLGAAAAVTAPDTAFNSFMSSVTAPGRQTVSFGSNGTPVVAAGSTTLTSDGASPFVKRTGSLPLPGGVRLPITATAKIPNSAIASMVKKALPYARTATNPLALTLLALELGFNLTTSDTGEPTLTQTVTSPSLCYQAPCYKWPLQQGGYTEDKQAAATSWCNYAQYPNTNCTFTVQPLAWQIVFYVTSVSSGTYASTARYGISGGAVLTPTPTEATSQQLADAIAAKSGWPSGSAVSQALVDAAKATGQTIETEQPTITGPASVVGPVEKISTPATPSTPYKDMTKSTNYDCTYVQGATVMDGGSAICTAKTTTVEEVTTVDPVTQASTKTTTTASEATKPAEITPDARPNEPPVDPCVKNPGRAGCVDIGVAPAPDVMSRTSQAVSVTAAAFASSNGCPSSIPLVAYGRSYAISYQPICDRLVYVKVLFLAMAAVGAAFILSDSFKV